MPALVVAGTRHTLDREAIIGRHRDCAVRILDAAASRQHARVFERDGQWWVEDLGSANGTILDGARLGGRAPIADGGVITIGAHEIRFEGPAAAAGSASGVQRAESAVGRTVAGYRIDRLLGKGPTGAVYVARQLNLERDVAFKVVAPAIADRPGFADTFLKGMGKAASLADDGLVRVHECGNDDGLLWYSMELVAGENLDQRIARDGTVEPDLAADAIARVAAVLGAAHARGVYHHDLRPAVVLITPEGRVKLCDVGLAAVFGRGRIAAGMPVSAAWYLAPEQAREGVCDARTDVYQLGAVLWHCLTGQPPFQGVTAKEVARAHMTEELDAEELDQVGRALRETVLAMLAKEPARRPQSLAEVAQRLDAARQGASAGRRDRATVAQENARRAQARAEAREAKGRRRLVLGGVAAAAVLICGAVAAKVLTAPQHDAADTPQGGTTVSVPVPRQAVPDATVPVAAAGTAAAPDPRWQAVQQQIDRNTARGEWGAAELALRRFRAQPMGEDVKRLAELAEANLAVNGGEWFRRQVAALPAAGTAAQLAARLRATVQLRDRAPAAQRSQAESLYQEGVSLLAQRLQTARRDARKALEAERFAELPGIAAAIAPAFAGTPLADLHRRFAAECAEAARLGRNWQPWAATATGAKAVAAGAGYLVLGVPDKAKAVLARTGADPAAIVRRQALTGGTAILARFDDPADMAAVDAPLGDVAMQGGTLTGAAGAPAAVAVAIPAGDLDATLVLRAQPAGAEPVAVVACDDWLVVELLGERPRIRLGQGLKTEIPIAAVAADAALRVRRQGGQVLVYLADQLVAEGPVPAGAGTLRLDVVGVRWALDEIQVFGGP
ncbi:MAG: Serine/threonine-protein kinase PknB [Planctomycetota bacterium]|jgi:serine/threonine-protein kinase